MAPGSAPPAELADWWSRAVSGGAAAAGAGGAAASGAFGPAAAAGAAAAAAGAAASAAGSAAPGAAAAAAGSGSAAASASAPWGLGGAPGDFEVRPRVADLAELPGAGGSDLASRRLGVRSLLARAPPRCGVFGAGPGRAPRQPAHRSSGAAPSWRGSRGEGESERGEGGSGLEGPRDPNGGRIRASRGLGIRTGLEGPRASRGLGRIRTGGESGSRASRSLRPRFGLA